jgi:hypothetical protein
MTANKNRPWTEEEERRLLALKAAGRSAVSISAALRRWAGAVEGRLSAIRARERMAKKADETAGSRMHYPGCKGA